MKINILLLLFGATFWGGCRFKEKREIQYLSEASNLNIPDNITDIHCRYIKNDDEKFPYDFYSRFKCEDSDYQDIRKQIFAEHQNGENDTNLYISRRMLASNKEYLYAYNLIDWWDVRNTVAPEKIYVNYFEDRGVKRIGDSTHFNGKIAIYYNKPYCYLYIACFPPR